MRIGLIRLDGSGDDLGLIDNDLALGRVYINLLRKLINRRANQMDWFFMGRLLAYRSYFHRRRRPGMVEFRLVRHVVMTWLSRPNIKVFYTAIGQMEWSVALGILWRLR